MFTKTEQLVISRLIQKAAIGDELKNIYRELGELGELGESAPVEKKEESRPDKPIIREIEEAVEFMEYAINNGFSAGYLCIIFNSHNKWPGKKDEGTTQPDSIKDFIRDKFNWSYPENKWKRIFSANKCNAIIDILQKFFPKWVSTYEKENPTPIEDNPESKADATTHNCDPKEEKEPMFGFK